MIKVENPNKDYGTPSPLSFQDLLDGLDANQDIEIVTATIDGQTVSVPKGTSVMRAAATLDVNIPRLCATDSIEAFGSCRLCLVAIEGRRGFPAS